MNISATSIQDDFQASQIRLAEVSSTQGTNKMHDTSQRKSDVAHNTEQLDLARNSVEELKQQRDSIASNDPNQSGAPTLGQRVLGNALEIGGIMAISAIAGPAAGMAATAAGLAKAASEIYSSTRNNDVRLGEDVAKARATSEFNYSSGEEDGYSYTSEPAQPATQDIMQPAPTVDYDQLQMDCEDSGNIIQSLNQQIAANEKTLGGQEGYLKLAIDNTSDAFQINATTLRQIQGQSYTQYNEIMDNLDKGNISSLDGIGDNDALASGVPISPEIKQQINSPTMSSGPGGMC